jgi:hypothetical protein
MDQSSIPDEPHGNLKGLDRDVLMAICCYSNHGVVYISDISDILTSRGGPKVDIQPAIESLFGQDYITRDVDGQIVGLTPHAMRVYEDILLHREAHPVKHAVGWPSKYVD